MSSYDIYTMRLWTSHVQKSERMEGINGSNTGQTSSRVHFIEAIQQRQEHIGFHPLETQLVQHTLLATSSESISPLSGDTILTRGEKGTAEEQLQGFLRHEQECLFLFPRRNTDSTRREGRCPRLHATGNAHPRRFPVIPN